MTALIGAMGLAANDPHWRMPGRLEDIWRLVVLGLAGLSLGFMVCIAQHCIALRVDPADNLIRPIGALGISYLLLTIFVGFHMIAMLEEPYITWRTPVAFIAFLVSCLSLFTLTRRIGRMVSKAKNTRAVVKLTMMDTGKPGPDVDLGKVQ